MSRITYALQRSIAVAWFLIACVAAVFGYWAVDRTPPFQMISQQVTNAKPGGVAYITAEVKRDRDRTCNVTFTRYLIDSTNTRIELTGAQYLTSSALAQMARDNPGRMKLAIEIPEGAAFGSAKIVSSAEYVCNPIQRLWPLDVLVEMPLELIP